MRRPALAPVNPPQPRASSPLDNSHSQDLLFIQVTMKSIRDRRLFERYQTVFLVLQDLENRLNRPALSITPDDFVVRVGQIGTPEG